MSDCLIWRSWGREAAQGECWGSAAQGRGIKPLRVGSKWLTAGWG